MNFNNVKIPKVPGGGGISALLKVSILGGLAVYGATNTLYNVEGGHRAIVFNRVIGVKDKVKPFPSLPVKSLSTYTFTWLAPVIF